MTVFDRLEAQLLDAHPNRGRRHVPRPAPRRIVAFAAAAAAVAAVAVAALSAGSSNSSTPAAQPGDAVPAVVPGKTTVAVLNATKRPGLGKRTAVALQQHGWKIGTVTNYVDQSLESSCVDFVPGRSAAASRIAEQLGIHKVLPATRLMTALAGPRAAVIVVVGADRS
jgi:LytR cell envelope-related transcriptional attenuator